MKKLKYDVIVVGSGISGLYSALKLEQNKKSKILLITKSSLGDSNSYYAQGGIVAVLKNNNNDSVQLHTSDTLNAGAGLSDVNTVKFISENSDKVIHDLLNFGVEFDKDGNGNLMLTKEAAHSVNRILHSGGDATGREIEKALCNAFRNSTNIELRECTTVVDILVNKNNECCGVITFDGKNYIQAEASAVILATGGLGQLYKYTTNPLVATGDGFALAYRAGAILQDMEFVQFHPTALAFDDEINHNRFLISEAVRGEGAKLCDFSGNEFMEKYHPQKELAPRDIVARANFCQMRDNNIDNVYLNATIIGKDKLNKRFPTISKKCIEHNIDISKDFIPVAPAAHYFMGGVKTNLNGETSVSRLYAVGEVASTGLHGANRLASNSLLECVVCAYNVAQNLIDKNEQISQNTDFFAITSKYEGNTIFDKVDIQKLKSELKDIMWANVGIFRDENSLQSAKSALNKIKKEFNRTSKCANMDEYELRNMIIVAQIITESALNRKESRGAHYRTDYPKVSKICEHSITKGDKFC